LMDVIKERNQIIWRLLLIMAEPIEKWNFPEYKAHRDATPRLLK
jgi:hypothetical protein